ncbi:hypothetical protein VFPPC_07183 [Pochonia chlamydosporia 170]|uniref:Uncharacterized protein n=1 Tax=Pochonia chlamydosporia 170 TaxID=1380566 RepID=A0A179F9M6_METCM|nr:hypothetical protein VFPPC_07183 [Pochonia chlamydosporia 170]OAQ62152.1 hypothetical protein VFPPC_07183 [Pochonia chlamydosporia 170]
MPHSQTQSQHHGSPLYALTTLSMDPTSAYFMDNGMELLDSFQQSVWLSVHNVHHSQLLDPSVTGQPLDEQFEDGNEVPAGNMLESSNTHENLSLNRDLNQQELALPSQLYSPATTNTFSALQSMGGLGQQDNLDGVHVPSSHDQGEFSTASFVENNTVPAAPYEESLLFAGTISTSIGNHSGNPEHQNSLHSVQDAAEIHQARRSRHDVASAQTTRAGRKAAKYRTSKGHSSRTFQGLFNNETAVKQRLEAMLQQHRKETLGCTSPDNDSTFPQSDDEYQEKVRRVFDAICDWSYILEWRAVLPKNEEDDIITRLIQARSDAQQQHILTETLLENFTPTKEELASILPPVENQQQKVLRQIPDDETIEMISWGIVAAAIKSQQGDTQDSKQVVKSLLTLGDAWKIRIVNHPRKELKTKRVNSKGNSAKAKLLKQSGRSGNVIQEP